MTDKPVPLDHTGDLLTASLQVYLEGVSANTRRNYEARIQAFLLWRDEQPSMPFVALLRRYIGALQARGLAARTVQAHINTIKGLVRTAAALDGSLAGALAQLDLVKPPRVQGHLQGQRLTVDQVNRLLAAPGTDSLIGLRDTAMLALMAVCGLRRSEVAALRWSHLTTLDGYPVIRNLRSKHGRVRTIKLKDWLWALLADWQQRTGLLSLAEEAPVFWPLKVNGEVDLDSDPPGIVPETIWHRLKHHLEAVDLPDVSPHDLRRTAAWLARRAGASIEQVQLMLGHASPQTTSDYIGETLDLDDHAVDYSPVSEPGKGNQTL